jgi:hypothetical protein
MRQLELYIQNNWGLADHEVILYMIQKVDLGMLGGYTLFHMEGTALY